MNKEEFNRAWAMATDHSISLMDVDDSHLHGCALPNFPKTATTIAPVAKILRCQCIFLNGSTDEAELASMRRIARYKFDLIGG